MRNALRRLFCLSLRLRLHLLPCAAIATGLNTALPLVCATPTSTTCPIRGHDHRPPPVSLGFFHFPHPCGTYRSRPSHTNITGACLTSCMLPSHAPGYCTYTTHQHRHTGPGPYPLPSACSSHTPHLTIHPTHTSPSTPPTHSPRHPPTSHLLHPCRSPIVSRLA